MVHCDPAPPHPDPGEVSMAICPPDLGQVAILLGIGLLIVLVVRVMARRADGEEAEGA